MKGLIATAIAVVILVLLYLGCGDLCQIDWGA